MARRARAGVVGMAEQSRGRRRAAVVASGAVVLGAAVMGLAGAPGVAHAAATCTIQFTSSDPTPAVGENITLRWTSSGADELVASWTTAHVPATGTQVTTKDTPGPASYRVTGLKSGQYCGGAAVTVVFGAAGAASSSVPATTSSAPTSSAATSSAATSTAVTTTAPSSTTAATPSESASFPAQSPTGGSSTPWYQQPLNLAVLGMLCLIGSIALFNRERVHALFQRRH